MPGPLIVRDAISRLNDQMPGIFSTIFGDASGHTGQEALSRDDLVAPVDMAELNSFFQLHSSARAPPREDEYSSMYS